MDGLDRLLSGIAAETDSRIAEIQAEGQERAQRLLMEARAKEEEIRLTARREIDLEVAALIARNDNQIEVERRRADLALRQSDVEGLLDEARTQLLQKPAAERVELYADLISQLALEPGEIILGEDDQELGERLLAGLPEGFSLASEIGRFQGGFVIRRGAIEENRSLDLVIRNNRPQLAAFASALLDPA